MAGISFLDDANMDWLLFGEDDVSDLSEEKDEDDGEEKYGEKELSEDSNDEPLFEDNDESLFKDLQAHVNLNEGDLEEKEKERKEEEEEGEEKDDDDEDGDEWRKIAEEFEAEEALLERGCPEYILNQLNEIISDKTRKEQEKELERSERIRHSNRTIWYNLLVESIDLY